MQLSAIPVIVFFCFYTDAQVSRDSTNPKTLETSMNIFTSNIAQDVNLLQEFMTTTKKQPIDTNVYQTKSFDENEAKTELANIAKWMKQKIQRKAALVTNIRQAAEEFYKTFDTNQTITCDNFVYDRAKALAIFKTNETLNPTGDGRCQLQTYIPLKQNPLLYNVSVNFDRTTSHVPTNVYDGSKSILMVANWTENLDNQLKENYKRDPTLKWQYFGSSHGMFKVFPGVRWHIQIDDIGEEKPVDFFDCRSQTWYIEAAAYPKDIVILVDKSGSMKGRRETIANLTVSEILSTLTENDFFNVLLFNESIFYADPIFSNMLLQATLKNKQRIMDVMNITPSGIADYAEGLRAAFNLLKTSRENEGTTGNCNQAIMVISDGAPDYFEELFNQENPEKDVRVFTYMIGQEASDRENVQRMACNNRGFFVQISTLADVKENVQTYLPVMARTNALNRERYTVWTGVHERQIKGEKEIRNPEDEMPEDITTTTTASPSTEPSGSSMGTAAPMSETNVTEKKKSFQRKSDAATEIFISVAQAVYDTKDETLEKNVGLLLGVAGLDVPVTELENMVPPWRYGIHGYVFAINNNGYIIFHPHYRPVYKNSLKPYYSNVDIEEVEHIVDMSLVEGNPGYNLSLRSRMIDRETGVEEMEVFNIPDDYLTVYRKRNKYFFMPLENTPYSIALALPWKAGNLRSDDFLRIVADMPDVDYQQVNKYFLYDLQSKVDCPRDYMNPSIVKLIPYEFCNFNEELIRIFHTDPLCAARNVILNKELGTALHCDLDFLRQVLKDTMETNDWTKEWGDKFRRSETRKKFGVDQVFTLRYSGLIRTYNETVPSDPYFIEKHLKGIRDPIFEATVDYSDFMKTNDYMYFHLPTVDDIRRRISGGRNISIVATTPVFLAPSKIPKIPVAVTGVQINFDQFKSFFMDSTTSCQRRSTKSNRRRNEVRSPDLESPISGSWDPGRDYGSLPTDYGCLTCKDPNVDCYLLTTNGYVLMSYRDDNDVGKPFGMIDCNVMESMLDMKFFKNQTVYDFQAVCTYPLSDSSFANRLLDPISRFIGYLVWTVYNLSIVLFDFFSYTLWASLAAAKDNAYQLYVGQPNASQFGFERPMGDLDKKIEREIKRCRNRTDTEEQMKCYQRYLNSLCRRVGSDAGSDCITACKLIRKYSPDHWNAHEKCIYPSKPCAKEYSIYGPNTDSISTSTMICNNCKDRMKIWSAKWIEKTNLVLVMVSPSRAKCNCGPCVPTKRSQEMQVIWSNITQPYRRSPGWNCQSETKRRENDSSCTNGSARLLLSFNGLLSLMATVFLLLQHNR